MKFSKIEFLFIHAYNLRILRLAQQTKAEHPFLDSVCIFFFVMLDHHDL